MNGVLNHNPDSVFTLHLHYEKQSDEGTNFTSVQLEDHVTFLPKFLSLNNYELALSELDFRIHETIMPSINPAHPSCELQVIELFDNELLNNTAELKSKTIDRVKVLESYTNPTPVTSSIKSALQKWELWELAAKGRDDVQQYIEETIRINPLHVTSPETWVKEINAAFRRCHLTYDYTFTLKNGSLNFNHTRAHRIMFNFPKELRDVLGLSYGDICEDYILGKVIHKWGLYSKNALKSNLDHLNRINIQCDLISHSIFDQTLQRLLRSIPIAFINNSTKFKKRFTVLEFIDLEKSFFSAIHICLQDVNQNVLKLGKGYIDMTLVFRKKSPLEF